LVPALISNKRWWRWFRRIVYGILGVKSRRNRIFIKGTGRTCWKKLESCVEGWKKRVGPKNVTLAYILLGGE